MSFNQMFSPDEDGPGDQQQQMGSHDETTRSMRQPVTGGQLAGMMTGGQSQVVQPPHAMPSQIWQRGNMPMPGQQMQQQQPQQFTLPPRENDNLLGSLQHQPQHQPQQQKQQPQLQQTPTNELFQQQRLMQQQQQRQPNQMGFQVPNMAAASSPQMLPTMLDPQQQQQQQHMGMGFPATAQYNLPPAAGWSGTTNMFGGGDPAWNQQPQKEANTQQMYSQIGGGASQFMQPGTGGQMGTGPAGTQFSRQSQGFMSDAFIPDQQQQQFTPYLMQQQQQQQIMDQQLQQQQQLLQQQQQLNLQQQQQLYGAQPSHNQSGMLDSNLIQQNPRAWQQFPAQLPTLPGFADQSFQNSPVSAEADQKRKPPNKRRTKSFPEKLMEAMQEYEEEDAFGWLPDGKSFVIIAPDKFVKNVLSKGFKEAKYASFIRKLHRWGFMRLTSGTGTDCFHHPLFQKARGDLVAKISCANAKDHLKLGRPFGLQKRSKDNKPPSLAGVEKFIRAKVEADRKKVEEQPAKASSDSPVAAEPTKKVDEGDSPPAPFAGIAPV